MTVDETIAAGRHLELIKRGRWEFARRRTASAVVAIVAVTDAGELLLVEQPRIPLGVATIELPAGLVGDEQSDEDLLDAARRELEEECGFTATTLRAIARGPSSAGLTDEIVTLVRAEGLRRIGAGGGVAGENITVHPVPLAGVAAWLQERAARGQLIDFKVWAGLRFAEQRP